MLVYCEFYLFFSFQDALVLGDVIVCHSTLTGADPGLSEMGGGVSTRGARQTSLGLEGSGL